MPFITRTTRIFNRAWGLPVQMAPPSRGALTSVVLGTSGNPPLAIPLTFTGTVRLDNAINLAGPSGLAPQSVDQGFDNAYVQSWNLNLQHQFTPFALLVGYVGSKGTHLITRRNINQPVNGVRPYPAYIRTETSCFAGNVTLKAFANSSPSLRFGNHGKTRPINATH